MLKKMLIAALTVAALAAVAAPSASATFLNDHQSIQENETETFTGTLQYTNAELGSFHCNNAEIQVQMLAGQTKGTVQKFQASNSTSSCHTSGAIAAICGTNAVHQIVLTHHADAQVVTGPAGAALKLQNFNLFTLFGSTESPCIVIELQNVPNQDFLLTPTNAATISTAHLSGAVQSSEWGKMTFTGQFHAHNPGTYGIVAA
jgi:hypothetical protein